MNPAKRPSFSVLHDKLRTKSTMYYATKEQMEEFSMCNLGETQAWQRQLLSCSRCDTLQLNFEYQHEMPKEEQENKTQDSQSTADMESLTKLDQDEQGPSLQSVKPTSKIISFFRTKKKKKEIEERKIKSSLF